MIRIINSFIFTTLLTINWSCSDRERLNPFDPQNPVTNGAPAGLTVTSHRKTVTLNWTPVEVNDLIGYNIYRDLGAGLDELYHTVSAPSVVFFDSDVQYDSIYSYTVQTITTFDISTISEPVVITPGPVNIWITDYYAMMVKRLTYDGTHVLGTLQLSSPIAIVVDTVNNQAIVADYWEQRLYILDLDLRIQSEISIESRPVDLAIDPASGRIHLLTQASQGLIITYDFSGNVIETIPLPLSVSIGKTLVYDQIEHSLWITGSDTLLQYRFQGFDQYILHTNLQGIEAIAIDPITGGCWVGLDSGIIKISGSGEIDTLKWSFKPFGLSVDPNNGDCYYTGYYYESGAWQTGRISSGGIHTDIAILGDEYPDLLEIQVVPTVESSGFIASQVYTWKLLRFDADGMLIGKLDNFNIGLDFALE